jgi:hypothetical protein
LRLVSFRVDCIGSTDSADPHHRLVVVGGTKADGLPWRLSVAAAILGIERGSWTLHVEGPNMEMVPLVVDFRDGTKYLTTERRADSVDGVDLLAQLPECGPVSLFGGDAGEE